MIVSWGTKASPSRRRQSNGNTNRFRPFSKGKNNQVHNASTNQSSASVQVANQKSYQKKSAMKCFNCGQNHSLTVCPTATDEVKTKLFEQHRDKFKRRDSSASTTTEQTSNKSTSKVHTIQQKRNGATEHKWKKKEANFVEHSCCAVDSNEDSEDDRKMPAVNKNDDDSTDIDWGTPSEGSSDSPEYSVTSPWYTSDEEMSDHEDDIQDVGPPQDQELLDQMDDNSDDTSSTGSNPIVVTQSSKVEPPPIKCIIPNAHPYAEYTVKTFEDISGPMDLVINRKTPTILPMDDDTTTEDNSNSTSSYMDPASIYARMLHDYTMELYDQKWNDRHGTIIHKTRHGTSQSSNRTNGI